MEPRYDAVVVGSGFGGSIAALRTAQSGRSVLVLERGRRWAPPEFPRDVTDLPWLLWNERRRPAWRGFYELRFFSGLGVAGAAGVGGGACRLCAECEFGCPHGAKNTLDFTYLRDAEANGAVIPASLGFHPAMTISAVAERIAEAVVAGLPNAAAASPLARPDQG